MGPEERRGGRELFSGCRVASVWGTLNTRSGREQSVEGYRVIRMHVVTQRERRGRGAGSQDTVLESSGAEVAGQEIKKKWEGGRRAGEWSPGGTEVRCEEEVVTPIPWDRGT